MEIKGIEEKLEVANSTEKAVDLHQEEEEEEEEEAPSLCDLPMNHNSRKEKSDEEKSTSNIPSMVIEIQQDFDFCSVSRESEMCAADEVFFQGQILPLRDSVSSEKGSLHYSGIGSISMSESMDYNSSSRSSSMGSSHQSSISVSSSLPKPRRHKPPPNHFHSHPSPSPRLKSSNIHGIFNSSNNNNRNCTKKTSWNIFRLGLVTAPPEIAFQDLKTRCPNNNNNSSTNCKNFGSRNSTSSSSSSGNKKIRPDKKRKPRGFLSGCKCTNDAVDTVLSCKITQTKKSAGEIEIEIEIEIEAPRIEDANENVEPMKPQEQQQGAKKQLSRHRTFEWLKQLSIEVPAHEA